MKVGYKVNLHYGKTERIGIIDKIHSKNHFDVTVKNPNGTNQTFLNVGLKPSERKLVRYGVPYWTERKQEKSKVEIIPKTGGTMSETISQSTSQSSSN